jgi:hypothetical protein
VNQTQKKGLIMNNSRVAKTTIALCSLSLVLLVVGIVFNISSAEETTATAWQPLSELVSADELAQIVADNTAPSGDRREIARTAVGLVQDDLLVIDFKTRELCGIGGCSIVAYRASTGEQVLSTYAVQTGPDQPIVELVERAGAEFPCLLISSLVDATTRELTRDALCYRDSEWQTEAP